MDSNSVKQVKTEIHSLLDASSSEGSGQLSELGEHLLPKLTAVAELMLAHLQRLEDQSRMHRQQAHRFRLDGLAQMSVRATHLANHEERLRIALESELTDAWSGKQPRVEIVDTELGK